MSGQHASPDEMPRFARQAGLSHEHEALALDTLLDGLPLPPQAPPELSALPPMLADLCGPADASELAGETATVTRFLCHLSPAGISPARTGLRRPGSRSAAIRARVAAAVAVAAVGLGGAAAAYAGVLPRPVQTFAHQVIGAPTAPQQAGGPGRPADSVSQHADLARHGGTPSRHPAERIPAAKETRPRKLAGPGKLARPGKLAQPGSLAHPGKLARPGSLAHPERLSRPGRSDHQENPARPRIRSRPAPAESRAGMSRG